MYYNMNSKKIQIIEAFKYIKVQENLSNEIT